jgi:hypothetical protein
MAPRSRASGPGAAASCRPLGWAPAAATPRRAATSPPSRVRQPPRPDRPQRHPLPAARLGAGPPLHPTQLCTARCPPIRCSAL